MESEESLVTRRSKRSTAGNRMEAALAELALEDVKDAEEDNDFVNDKEEEDVFESDFASTDEEAVQEEMDAGDNAVHEEEKRARKTARSRLEKATAAAHARQKATFNPQAQASSPAEASASAAKSKRRVALGGAINAETGEVIEGTKRQSRRTHTIMNTSATVNRIKNAEVKKAAVPKKIKVNTRAPTQDELIARALDNEEGNIVEHRDYLKLEEEKRARARVVRPTIEGPMLRWVSRKEQVKIPQLQPDPRLAPPPQYSFVYGVPPGTAPPSTSTFTYTSPFHTYTAPSYGSAHQGSSAGPTSPNPPAPTTALPAPQPSHPPGPPQVAQPYYGAIPAVPPLEDRIEDVCKNYIVHELSQARPATKPLWKDTMSAMFGDHVRWDELRVFTGKQRPLTRPQQICPITGASAKYLDPRTNVPFANVGAYHTLTKILSHEYVWSDGLSCYVSRGENSEAPVVEDEPSGKRRKVDAEDG
ncbi:hypothetical protein BV22DRAFT_1098016 [Leucogyrophana mollusca]|uniref:Uncharacterized protein n=1 Tax=Leucogyrophana mollusca TaxID=85980 RepID=A0ACB8B5I9_9AGAM|nr:hypothetical protein BV22DRAFT_1098016 [Leucogyrophana mollusca]